MRGLRPGHPATSEERQRVLPNVIVAKAGSGARRSVLAASTEGETIVTDASDADAEPGTAPEEKQALGADLIIPVGTILFAVYYLYTVWDLPWQAKTAGLGIAGAMAIVLALLAVRFVREWSAGRANLGLGDLACPTVTLAQRLGLLAAAAAFVFAMPLVGFTLGLFLFLMAGMIILSGLSQLKSATIIALLVSLGGYLLFIVLIRARFPQGPVETLLAAIF
jgi:hypothetical protein